MPKTRNGFPVVPPAARNKELVTITVGGVKFLVLKDAQRPFKRLLVFLNAVELFSKEGWDGGYAYRPVRGSTTVWSEHSSGTAIDVNASRHPRGVKNAGWTPSQIRVIEWYLKYSPTGQLFTWGNNFKTTPDPMHFEIKNPAGLAAWNKRY